MSTMKPLTAIVCDERRAKNNGKFPVKLRVNYDRQQKYFNLGIDLSMEEFARAQSVKPRGDAKNWQLQFIEFETRAQEIINKIVPFSFYEFERQLLENKPPKLVVYDAFTDYIDQLKEEGRLKTAISYSSARNSLESFYENANFVDINVSFLQNFEKMMKLKGRTDTTIGIYLRSLRTIFNIAIEAEVIPRKMYPFGRRRYIIPLSRNAKKALTLEEVRRLYEIVPEPFSLADRAKDFWMFSYLCSGMNFKDIAFLKYEDMDDDTIFYIREKTKRTSRGNQRTIMVPILPEARAIIDKWGTKSEGKDDYIFPILQPGMTPEKQIAAIGQCIQVTNAWMRKMATKAGIKKDVTTYVARHTFSTVLKRSGASTEFISEQLGHHSLLTTQSYLDSFENKIKRSMAERLLDFSGLSIRDGSKEQE